MSFVLRSKLKYWNRNILISSVFTTSITSRTFESQGLTKNQSNIVLVDGVRTPFMVSNTKYSNTLPYELARHSITSLIKKTEIEKDLIDHVVYAIGLQELTTSNVAREAALSAGLSNSTIAHTVTMACIGSNQAITTGIGLILSGACDSIIAGGVEISSNCSLRYTKEVRQILWQSIKAKTIGQKIALYSQLRPSHFIIEKPSMVDCTSNELLGSSADRLSASFKISRHDQDEYALRSHNLAKRAEDNGFFTDIVPYKALNIQEFIQKDNGIRVSNMEQLSKLQPEFIKPHGTVTAGNSSVLTDGASACLIMSELKAKQLNLKPKAFLRDFVYVAQDPIDQLLLGPAYAIPKLLKKTKLTINDIDTWEIHEAFAGQILANFKALESDWFCKNFIGLDGKFGAPHMEKLNAWGGSLSIGHPFSATGVRLAMHAVNRLIKEDGQLAMVASCSSGGLGVAMILERHPEAKIK